MKINVDKLKNKLNPRFLLGGASSLLEKKSKYLIFALMLSLVAYGSFVWYRYVYSSEWNDSRKEEYMSTKDRGTVLNKGRFDEIVAEKEKRNTDYQKDMKGFRDIFNLK